jgi:hypothetical protein
VHRLYAYTNFGERPLIRKSSVTQFKTYLRQTKHLANLVHNLNPEDLAWKFYDKDIAIVEDEFAIGGHYRRWKEISARAVRELHKALDMVLGAASRIFFQSRPNPIPHLAELGQTLKYGPLQKSLEARAVIADALEERGLTGEANVLRQQKGWATDKKILIAIGIPVPNYEPYHKRDPGRIRQRRGRRIR